MKNIPHGGDANVLADPGSHFETPQEVSDSAAIGHSDKLNILTAWRNKVADEISRADPARKPEFDAILGQINKTIHWLETR